MAKTVNDAHSRLAAEVLGIQPHEVLPDQHKAVKNGLFAVMYSAPESSWHDMLIIARVSLNVLSRKRGPVN